MQHGEVCTVDASIPWTARALWHLESGHYFISPLHQTGILTLFQDCLRRVFPIFDTGRGVSGQLVEVFRHVLSGLSKCPRSRLRTFGADGGTVGGSAYDRVLVFFARICGAEHVDIPVSHGGRREEVLKIYAQDRIQLLHLRALLVLRLRFLQGFFELFTS